MAINCHYRKGMVFGLEGLKTAKSSYEKLLSAVSKWREENVTGKIDEEFRKLFVESISNDLAMPEAWAVVWRLVKSDLSDGDKLATILDFDKVLGLRLDQEIKEEKIPDKVLEMAEERQKCKELKNWPEADSLRGKIKEEGFLIEDTKDGYNIRRNSGL